MSDIEQRKIDHLEIVLAGKARPGQRTSGFERVEFVHCALPEIDLANVDLATTFLGRTLQAPLLVSSMTGGPQVSERLNETIAEVCNARGIAFGVGSQRIALEGGKALGFNADLRRRAPNTAILANFGAAQLLEWNGIEMARRAVDMIEADGLIIHLNPLQEALQPEGDTRWSGVLAKIEAVSKACPFPVICKEVGSGLSGPVARQLVAAGVQVIDVAGAGGTSWAAVEAERAVTPRQRLVAEAFRDWGLETARAVVDVRRACPDVTVMASGGLANGVDCAKAIRLGADMAAMAGAVVAAAVRGLDELDAHLDIIVAQLRVACFCTGSRNLAELRKAALVSQSYGTN